MSFQKIVDNIFKKEPDPPCSKQLRMEMENASNDQVFEKLAQLLGLGIKKLYGDKNGHVKLENLTEEHEMHIRKCMRTIGWDCIIRKDKQQPNHLQAIRNKEGAPLTLVLPRKKNDTKPLMIQFVPFIDETTCHTEEPVLPIQHTTE